MIKLELSEESSRELLKYSKEVTVRQLLEWLTEEANQAHKVNAENYREKYMGGILDTTRLLLDMWSLKTGNQPKIKTPLGNIALPRCDCHFHIDQYKRHEGAEMVVEFVQEKRGEWGVYRIEGKEYVVSAVTQELRDSSKKRAIAWHRGRLHEIPLADYQADQMAQRLCEANLGQGK